METPIVVRQIVFLDDIGHALISLYLLIMSRWKADYISIKLFFRLEHFVRDNSTAIISRMLGRAYLGARLLVSEDMRRQETLTSA